MKKLTIERTGKETNSVTIQDGSNFTVFYVTNKRADEIEFALDKLELERK